MQRIRLPYWGVVVSDKRKLSSSEPPSISLTASHESHCLEASMDAGHVDDQT